MVLAASFLETGISASGIQSGGGQKVPAGANLESECFCGLSIKWWLWVCILPGVMMKIRDGLILCAGATLLAGCAGFWNLPASTTTTTTTATTLSSGVFYVLNQTTKQIAAYYISSGTLEQVSGSPYTLAAGPIAIAVAPGGGFLYVGTAAGIYVYSVLSGGGLQLVVNQNINADVPATMAVQGSWLIAAYNPIPLSQEVEIDAIPISTSTGLSVASSSNPIETETFSNIANASVQQMVLSPDGTNLFIALQTGGTIVVPFTAGNANPLGSTATVIPVAVSGGSAVSVAVDPTNRLFYIGETLAVSSSGGLRVFNYSSLGTGNPRSSPTQITGSPIASGGGTPHAILPEASGDYVYVANWQGDSGSGNIEWFPLTVSGTTYTVAAGSTIATGIEPYSLAEDSDKDFILAVSFGENTTSGGDPDLEAFSMSSGALTANITSATGTDPVGAIAVAALP
jgi:hypothetical protein